MFVAGPNWLKKSFLIFHGWWPSGKLPVVAATPRQGAGHGSWHPFPHLQRVSTLHSHKGTTVRVLHLGNHTVRAQEWGNTVNNPQWERSLKRTTEYSLGNNCRFPLLPLFSVSTDKRMQENWGVDMMSLIFPQLLTHFLLQVCSGFSDLWAHLRSTGQAPKFSPLPPEPT